MGFWKQGTRYEIFVRVMGKGCAVGGIAEAEQGRERAVVIISNTDKTGSNSSA